MERKDIDRNLPLESYINDNAKQLQLQVRSDTTPNLQVHNHLAGEVNPTCASLSIPPSSSSSSSSSSSPPCFLKSVQAALKRHRPLGTMQTDALRARRVPIRQRRSSRFANGPVAAAVAGENVSCRDSAQLVANEDLGVACNQEKGSSEDFSPTLSSCSGTSPEEFPVREVDIVEKGSAQQQQLVKAMDDPNAASSSDAARHRITGPMVDCGSSSARFVEEKCPLEEISPTACSNPDCITTWLEEGVSNNISFISSKSVHSAHVPSRIISSDIHHKEMQPFPPEEIKSRFQGAPKDSREEQAMSVINTEGFPSQISPNSSTERKMLSELPPIKGQVPKQPISQHAEMTEISVKNLTSQVEKIHGRVFDPPPMDPILPCSTMSSSCAITMSCHSGPPQSTGVASASKATVPTEVLAGSDGVQDAADNRLGPVGKESNRLLDPVKVPLFYGSTEGKVVRGDACILQPPSNSFSNANVDASKCNREGKASGKKKYDPDLFFKVNGKLYQKLGKIGSGGSSEVYKVIASDCNIFALKRIKLKGRDYPTACGFCQEIEYLNKFKGRNNIIQLIDYEVTDKALLKEVMNGCMTTNIGRIKADSYIYMVLEYGEIDLAHMLSQKLKDSESITWNSKENWIRFYWQQMLEAVNTIHEERIVHSDLKPANFLLVKGSLKLIDFGIAKAILSDTTNIQRDAQVGTLNYMSPEAFMWNEQDETGSTIKCGRPSDIWSLGCILYQMVYGKTPFADYKTFWAKFKVITDRNYDIVYEHLPNPWLIDLLKKCLAWDRDERWRIPQLLQHPFLNPPFIPLKD